MKLDAAVLARTQFALTVSFHRLVFPSRFRRFAEPASATGSPMVVKVNGQHNRKIASSCRWINSQLRKSCGHGTARQRDSLRHRNP
jgi:hypothetical protein